MQVTLGNWVGRHRVLRVYGDEFPARTEGGTIQPVCLLQNLGFPLRHHSRVHDFTLVFVSDKATKKAYLEQPAVRMSPTHQY